MNAISNLQEFINLAKLSGLIQHWSECLVFIFPVTVTILTLQLFSIIYFISLKGLVSQFGSLYIFIKAFWLKTLSENRLISYEIYGYFQL